MSEKRDEMRAALHKHLTRCKNGEITIDEAINQAMDDLNFNNDIFRVVMVALGETWIRLYEAQHARLNHK